MQFFMVLQCNISIVAGILHIASLPNKKSIK